MLSTIGETTRGLWIRTRFWFAALFITGYLTVLGAGLFCHTFGWKVSSHPVMYYIVWDMFCGWSAYDFRYHVVAEGASGEFYQVLPAPWGEYVPFDAIGRRHYDIDGVHATRMAMNVLKHTQHEDITRLFVVEETWAKKYNMPDRQWDMCWDTPKDPVHYFTPRHIVTAEGDLLQTFACFTTQNSNRALYANPRLAKEVQRSQPFYLVNHSINQFEQPSHLADSEAIRGSLSLVE